ncbi:MAG: porin family protein, partial [Myxococcota bacterium]|nr:porin family protein [Myxococcota bacterium]
MQSFRFLCGTQALGVALAVAVVGLGEGAARAEEETRPEVEIGLHGGGHFFSDTNRLGRDLNPTEDNALRNSGVIGARIGLGLGRHFMPEVELAIIPTETMNQLAQVTVLGWRAHLLYHITTTRLRPFILAGGGALSSFSRNQDQLRDQTVGVFHVGTGLKLDLSERFGLRL